jgi:hypothetical protein
VLESAFRLQGSPRGGMLREITEAPIAFNGDESGYFQSLCAHYSTELRARIPVTPNEVREKNIRAINAIQKERLRNSGVAPGDFEEGTRRLNIYFRTGSDGRVQMDPLEFGVITWILNWYVHEGRSRAFNALSLVSRLKGDYPDFIHSFSPAIEYLDVTGEAFNRACSVGANTLHLTHGSTVENKYGSIPILGRSTREDSVVMERCSDYVPLMLYYPEGQRPHNRDITLNERDFSGSFRSVMEETIRAVKALEDKILEEI